jgi:hypothetical protein
MQCDNFASFDCMCVYVCGVEVNFILCGTRKNILFCFSFFLFLVATSCTHTFFLYFSSFSHPSSFCSSKEEEKIRECEKKWLTAKWKVENVQKEIYKLNISSGSDVEKFSHRIFHVIHTENLGIKKIYYTNNNNIQHTTSYRRSTKTITKKIVCASGQKKKFSRKKETIK